MKRCISNLLLIFWLFIPMSCDIGDRYEYATSFEKVCINDKGYLFHNPYRDRGTLHLKGSIHNHTDNSEPIDSYGSGDPYTIACKLRDIGKFDFYTFTDHNYVTNDPKIDSIIWIGTAFEDTKIGLTQQHLCVYNLPENFIYNDFSGTIQELIDYYHGLGAVVTYAHPDWDVQYQSNDKISSVQNVHFVEVLNSGNSGSERAYALMQRREFNVFCVGVDDYHYSEQWDDPNMYFDKAYIFVYAKEKTRESIWDALISGSFYASNGTIMDIQCVDLSVIVKCNRISKIELITPDKKTENQYRVVKTYDDVDSIIYAIDGSLPIFWFKVTNADGIAISQAFKIFRD